MSMSPLQFTPDTIRMLGLHGLAVYMLIRCAEQEGQVPVTHQWILDRMPGKTSPNTVTAELRRLTSYERQFLIRVKGGWRLNREKAFQLPLTYNLPDPGDGGRIQVKNLSESENLPESDSYFENRALRDSRGQDSTINFGPFIQRRIEEENLLINIDSSSSIISSENRALRDSENDENPVRKTALADKEISRVVRVAPDEQEAQLAKRLLQNLKLLFDPKQHGVLTIRLAFRDWHPEDLISWIAKAYHEQDFLTKGGGPIGLIVARMTAAEHADEYYARHYGEILPIEFLEVVGLFECECDYCDETFGTRAAREEHRKEKHPHVCMECGAAFKTEEQEHAHYDAVHNPDNPNRKAEMDFEIDIDPSVNVVVPGSHLSPVQAWQSVLGQLQMEMPRASFDTWVRDAKALRFENGVISVAVRNAYARDWLDSRLTGTINRLLIGILNANICVNFIVEGS